MWIRAHLPLILLVASATACEAPAATLGPRASTAAVAAARAVDGARLHDHVAALVAARATDVPFTPAWYPLPHTSARSTEYMVSSLAGLGLPPVIESLDENGIVSQNVFADIPGTTRPHEIVLLTGHHDAWYSGADDNASAMAVLLEAARVLRDVHPDRTIRILAFDVEEYGLIGSQRYLQLHAEEHVEVILNMDCVGFAAHEPGTQGSIPGLQSPTVGDFLVAASNEPAFGHLQEFLGLSRSISDAPTTLGLAGPGDIHTGGTSLFLRSDHAPFWRAGTPGLFLTDTADLRNPNYHRATDTPDTLDYTFLTHVARLIVGATVAYATVD